MKHENHVIGTNVKFHYKARHLIGLAIFFVTAIYSIYGFMDLALEISLNPNTTSRTGFYLIIGLFWLVSMIVYYGFFDKPMRAKVKSWI